MGGLPHPPSHPHGVLRLVDGGFVPVQVRPEDSCEGSETIPQSVAEALPVHSVTRLAGLGLGYARCSSMSADVRISACALGHVMMSATDTTGTLSGKAPSFRPRSVADARALSLCKLGEMGQEEAAAPVVYAVRKAPSRIAFFWRSTSCSLRQGNRAPSEPSQTQSHVAASCSSAQGAKPRRRARYLGCRRESCALRRRRRGHSPARERRAAGTRATACVALSSSARRGTGAPRLNVSALPQ